MTRSNNGDADFSRPQPSRRLNTTTLFLIAAAYIVSFLSPLAVFDIPRERVLLAADVPWIDDKIDHSSLQLPSSDAIYPNTPNDDNTLITLIAMGLPSHMHLTERCVRSIRARGNFTGHIMIFTDSQGMQKYQRTLIEGLKDDRILLVQGKEEDVHPRHANGTRVQYTKHTMKYKRYKTLSSKYLQEDYPQLSPQIQYMLYLDIDNVVTNPLSIFFQDYQHKINKDYANANVHETSSHSLVSFWMDATTNKGKTTFQGGQFMLERKHGQRCLDAWRKEMDSVLSDLDQPLLMRVAEQYERYHCVVSLLPDEPKERHFALLQKDFLSTLQPEHYPTIVHISGLRAKRFSETYQRNFLQKALNLSEKSMKEEVVLGLPWKDIIKPMGVKGQQPKEQ